MKKIIVMYMFLLVLPLVLGVRIEEVYYDPLGEQNGGEGLVISNPSDVPKDISGWSIATRASMSGVVFPKGTLLLPNQYFLIADGGWSELKDNENWPDADLESGISLANTNAWVALFDLDQNLIDGVAWGNPTDGVYNGSPASHVTKGSALVRVNETGDGNLDFTKGEFLSKKSPSDVLYITLLVPGPNQEIISVKMQGSESLEVMPLPGNELDVLVEVEVLKNITPYLDGVAMHYIEANVYGANLSLPYTKKPGMHTFNISSGDVEETITYEVLSMMALHISEQKLTVNGSFMSSIPSLKNIGNVPIDLTLQGTNFYGLDETLPPSVFTYSFGSETPLFMGVLGSDPEKILVGISPAESLDFVLQATIPESTIPGNYFGSIVFSGEETQ